MTNLELVARALCAERCAVYGEPPCHTVDGYDGSDCVDDAPCRALARAVFAALAQKGGDDA